VSLLPVFLLLSMVRYDSILFKAISGHLILH
jgi:hypothetical protein